MIFHEEFKALNTSFFWHDEQKRKYNKEPYVNHFPKFGASRLNFL
jgi:hypothetical protein